jgi:subtilase family serine protease
MHFSKALASSKAEGKLKPGFGTGTGLFAVGPGDFAKIYNLPPTTGAGALDGTGQTIAIVARSNVTVSDINQFGTGFGISNLTNFTAANNIVLASADPGVILGDDGEATLDVEWSGAVAPKATIKLVVADGTATTSIADGVDLSALFIIQNNLAQIMSESFGLCETFSDNQFDQFLWEQAAAQGITVMVSAGDNGSAACDPDGDPLASTHGLAVSGTASTPFNVAVGGTDFDDASNPLTFWNNTAALETAKSYIPEIPWNDTCASAATIGHVTGFCTSLDQQGLDLLAGSGGPSTIYPKPTFQPTTLTGMPNDSLRDIPDVSLFAAVNSASNHFYIICLADSALQNGQPCNLTGSGTGFNFTGVGGTSASSPAFAGIMALVNQSEVNATRLKATEGQGNVNYVLYKLAAAQQAAPATTTACNSNGATLPVAACVFNDVTKGNNSVACDGGVGALGCSATTAGSTGILLEAPVPPYTANAPGWAATAGYDLATGLGSVNVTKLAANWGSVVTNFTPSTTTITAPASVNIAHGATVNFVATVTSGSGTPTGDVSLIAKPTTGPQQSVTGGTLGFNTTPGQVLLTNNFLPGGTYPVFAHYAGDGTFAPSDSPDFTVTVAKENSTVAASMIEWATNTPSAVTSAPYGSLYLFRYDVLGSAPNDNQVCANVAIPCPTGTITVTHDGGTPLNDFLNTATGGSTNVATLNVLGLVEDRVLGSTGLPGGAHTIVAAYSGDISYNASTAPALSFTITPASTQTLVTVNGQAAVTVQAGQQVSLVATVQTTTPQFGLFGGSTGAGPTGSVTFSACGTAASCTVTPVVSTAGSNTGGAAFATATLPTTFTTAGTQNITATFTSGDGNYFSCTTAVNTATQICNFTALALTVTDTPTKLAFVQQPTTVAVGASITPAVTVALQDASGNVVTSATNQVTIAIANNAGPGGVLGGTLTAIPVNGVATFSNLSINKAGTGYTLTATATPALTPATSSAFNVTGATGSFAISYSPNPLVLSSTTGAAAPLTVTVTPSGGFTGQVSLTATAASLPPGVTCPNSPLNINIVAANPVANTLNCQVTATSTGLTASILREERMYEAKVMPPTQTIPPSTGGKGWWALSAGTGFAALFLMFLPGGRKKYRAALGLGLVCLLGITLGCNGVYNGGTKPPVATTTQMTVTNASAKVNSGTAFTFSVTVTGGTPGGMAQLFDGGVAISTAGASATVSGGKATLSGPTTLSVGTHSISVHYLGDTTTLASQSGSLNLTVAGGSTIAVTTTPVATPAAAAINITVQ